MSLHGPSHTRMLCVQIMSRGWRALYRGNLLNVLRSAPQKALDFFTFDLYKVTAPQSMSCIAREASFPSRILSPFPSAGTFGGTE